MYFVLIACRVFYNYETFHQYMLHACLVSLQNMFRAFVFRALAFYLCHCHHSQRTVMDVRGGCDCLGGRSRTQTNSNHGVQVLYGGTCFLIIWLFCWQKYYLCILHFLPISPQTWSAICYMYILYHDLWNLSSVCNIH